MIIFMAIPVRLHKTFGVRVGNVQVGRGAPILVQTTTMTDGHSRVKPSVALRVEVATTSATMATKSRSQWVTRRCLCAGWGSFAPGPACRCCREPALILTAQSMEDASQGLGFGKMMREKCRVSLHFDPVCRTDVLQGFDFQRKRLLGTQDASSLVSEPLGKSRRGYCGDFSLNFHGVMSCSKCLGFALQRLGC